MLTRLARNVTLGALLAIPAGSPMFAQDSIRLQFELYRNATLLSKPIIVVSDGAKGSMSVTDLADISFVANRISAERVSLAFEIVVGGETIRPRLTLAGSGQGTLSLKPSGARDSLEIRLAISEP